MTGRLRTALALGLLLPLGLAACGRRGPPVAPERRLPAAVADLSATVAGEGVRLAWTLPRVRVDRSPVKELRRTEVYRRLEAPGSGPAEPLRPAILTFGGLFGGPSGIPGFERIADIVLVEPGDRVTVQGGQVAYTDAQGLAFGQRYTYVVVAVDDQGRPSPPSNRVAVAVAPPPRPPTGVTARGGDREVRLQWTAPSALEDGSPAPAALLYDVFRSRTPEGPAPGAPRPLNPEPLRSPQYVDLAVENDATYYYAVRARVGPGSPVSRPSEVASATPEDTTPPAQPRGLVAVAAGRTVRLAWEGVGDADLAGYHVYRGVTAGRGHERLTSTPQAATTFVDGSVEPGRTYFYVVTAVDRGRRANESIPSPEVSATIAR
jgi:hypothetical protein